MNVVVLAVISVFALVLSIATFRLLYLARQIERCNGDGGCPVCRKVKRP